MPYKDKEKQREAQRKWEKENRGAGKRHKVWMFIFYPDTAEVGWRDEWSPFDDVVDEMRDASRELERSGGARDLGGGAR